MKVHSLCDCPCWSKKRLQKIGIENINRGEVEGFIAMQNRYYRGIIGF